MKLRGVSKLKGELAEQKLHLTLDPHLEVIVGLPVRGVIQTLRGKRPCTEGKYPQRKKVMKLSAEGEESWRLERGDEDGTWGEGRSPERVGRTCCHGKDFWGGEGGSGDLAAFLPG